MFVNKTVHRKRILLKYLQYKNLAITLKMLRTFVNISRTRKDLWIKPVQRCSTRTNSVTKDNTERIFLDKQNLILNMLNTSDLDVLTRYMCEPNAEKIILHRTKNGPFKSLNDLTNIQDIELDVLNSLWISPIEKPQLLKLKRSMIMPKTKLTTVPNQILGLHVGSNVISWAMVSSSFKILHLDFINWNDQIKKSNSYDFINLASSIAKMLPLSSSYVIEEFSYSNKISYRYLAQQKLSVAIMSCVKMLDEQRKAAPSLLNSNFYVLQPQISAQFFHLVVGGESIASRYIIGTIFCNFNLETKPFESIYVSDQLRSNFVNVTPEQQEQIGWSLLKAITGMYLLKFFKDG